MQKQQQSLVKQNNTTSMGSTVNRTFKQEDIQRFNNAFTKVNMQNILKNRSNMGNMSHSTEKGSRSRNKKGIQQNQTHNIMNKFDSSIMDMHFRTTTSVST